MSHLLTGCCCECSSSNRVFVPCAETFETVEYRAPMLTSAQMSSMGFDENTVYHYDDPIDGCDSYCGTWRCVADAEDHPCHPDTAGGAIACGDCADWSGTVAEPFRVIRTSEEAAFPGRFDAIASCCASTGTTSADFICPSNCGQGNIIPGDCSTCFDWSTALAGAAVRVTETSNTQGTVTDSGGNLLATVDASLLVQNVSFSVHPTIATRLVVEWDLVAVYVRSTPSQNLPADCSNPPLDYFCCDECQGESGTCPQTIVVRRNGCSADIDCMDEAGVFTSGSLVRPASTCISGGVAQVDYSVGCSAPSSSVVNTGGSAAGWGAIDWPVYSATHTAGAELDQMVNMPGAGAGGTVVDADVDATIEILLSLSDRPSAC